MSCGCTRQLTRSRVFCLGRPTGQSALAGGLGYLLAQQLVSVGETVLDVQPKLASRVRLLATGNVNKNDPMTPARWPSPPAGARAYARWPPKTMPSGAARGSPGWRRAEDCSRWSTTGLGTERSAAWSERPLEQARAQPGRELGDHDRARGGLTPWWLATTEPRGRQGSPCGRP